MSPVLPFEPRPKRPRRHGKPAIGFALAGGGPLGAVYEIGALAALQESIEGLDVNDAEIYVGISAGGIIASGLANGVTPYEMCRAFIESDVEPQDSDLPLFKPEMLMRPALEEFVKRALMLPGLVAASLYRYLRSRKTSLPDAFERLKEALPTGLLSNDEIERFLRATFAKQGRSNDFRRLQKKLVIVATDLDTGEAVRFGAKGYDDIPISRAVQASASVPGLFPPVVINGRHFVDGALRKTMHASIALEHGVDVLFCLNPIVPYDAHGAAAGAGGADSKLANGGLVNVLSQALRAILHSRMEVGMGNYRRTYPDTDILLFQPAKQDSEMFFTNMFSYNNRRRMCEMSYQNTRMFLWEKREEIGAKLARHGLRLKESVLRDTSLTLVKQPPSGRRDRLAVTWLNEVLDELDRYLKVENG
ncbi:patatin-like phospholipase family protein [Massilia sp. W12]|uniref:patatin-like phospholipase family protein n=1 Tax=Massilia sp. W12 TaxID=3126507 RepID=UPI0030D407AB